MLWEATRFVFKFSRPSLIASLVAATMALTGCVTEDPGTVTPVDGPKGIEVGDKDLPRLLSASYQSTLEPTRTFLEEKRIRLVQLNPEMAANGGALLSGSKRFVLNLFDDVSVVAETDRMDLLEEGRFTLNGRILGAEGGFFILSFNQGAVSATVSHPVLGQFELEASGGLWGKLSEFDINHLPRLGHGMLFPEGTEHIHNMADSLARPAGLAKVSGVAATPILDIMVVYTAAAAAGSGGATAMLSRIDKAIAEVNNAFVNSKIDAKANLVRAQQVTYTESGNMSTDLGRLQNTTDGLLDEVHALRNTYKADFVSLIVEQAGGIAGIGYVMTSVNNYFKNYAFTVVGRVYTGSYNTLAHELGHNLGCAHDRNNSTSPAAFSYSYGHRFYGTNGTQYRTIMSYAPGSSIPYFSNPNVLYQGTPTGIPEGQANSADNARTINATAPVAEAFFPKAIITPPDPPAIPAGWSRQDIGSVGLAGTFTGSNGSFTASGSGADIWGAADGFGFAYQTLDGDGMITARVVSVQNTDGWAKAGVMIRENNSAGSRHALMALTSANGAAFQRREAANGQSLHTGTAAGPRWMRIVRSGNSLKGYHSSDGSTWTLLGETIQTLPTNVMVGLAVTSHNNTLLSASTFDNVAIVKTVVPGVVWSPNDIGSVLNAGSATGTGTVTVKGDGADIWNNADAFFYWNRKISGDGEIKARVTAVQNTDGWAKAGVMIRENLTPGSRHVSTFVTSANGVAFQRREAQDGVSLHGGVAGAAPRWVRVVRAGNLFTSSTSSDGVTWSIIGTSIVAMGSEVTVGLAVTSHLNGTPNTSTFDQVTVVD